jgi:hypothetical protein
VIQNNYLRLSLAHPRKPRKQARFPHPTTRAPRNLASRESRLTAVTVDQEQPPLTGDAA